LQEIIGSLPVNFCKENLAALMRGNKEVMKRRKPGGRDLAFEERNMRWFS
jgi:hypothetical protein